MELDGNVLLRTAAAGEGVSLAIADTNITAREVLGMADDQVAGAMDIAGSVAFAGLTIDSPNDTDWYTFRLADVAAAGSIAITSASFCVPACQRCFRCTRS